MGEKTMGQLILEVMERLEAGQKRTEDLLMKVLKALPADVDLNEKPEDPKKDKE
jgi:hypothetical protein